METNSKITIDIISDADVLACGYTPDAHTVSLKDKGTWYCLSVDGVRVTFLCIREQQHEMYIGEVFTAHEYRRKGYFYTLLNHVVNTVYLGYSVNTHALKASKGTFERCGFKQYNFRHFKYGDQWWLRREGKRI